MSEPKPTYTIKGIRRTAKLQSAVGIFAGERYCDCHPEEIYAALEQGLLTYKMIYFGIERMGYSWSPQERRWWHRVPIWVIRWHLDPDLAKARRIGQRRVQDE